MGIELSGFSEIKKQKIKKNKNFGNLPSAYTLTSARPVRFSNQGSMTHYNLQSLDLVKNNFCSNCPRFSIGIRHISVNFSTPVFINNSCISNVACEKNVDEEIPTFKIRFSYDITYANSTMKPLFPYNCKNIVVHFFKKIIL